MAPLQRATWRLGHGEELKRGLCAVPLLDTLVQRDWAWAPGNEKVPWVDMPSSPEAVLKALELLQGVINRLSGHSFLVKGWAITVVVGLLTFTGSTGQLRLAWLVAVPIVMFWMIDGFLLAREREYRARFEALRLGQAEPFDFRLSPLLAGTWLKSTFSSTLRIFYGCLVGLTLAVLLGIA